MRCWVAGDHHWLSDIQVARAGWNDFMALQPGICRMVRDGGGSLMTPSAFIGFPERVIQAIIAPLRHHFLPET